MDYRKKFDTKEMVYPVWQAVALAQDLTATVHDGSFGGIKIPLPSLNKVLNPFGPETLITILGRPQNAKTFVAMWLLQETMAKIQREQKANSICILITTEVSVEKAAMYWIARSSGIPVTKMLRGELTADELQKVDEHSYKVMGLPLFIIGHSIQRSKDNRRSRPALSPDRINDAIEYILNEYKDPATGSPVEVDLIVTDYLQRLHNDTRKNPQEFYSGCVDWAKDLALWAGAPHVLNVQARRDVDDRQIKIPMMRDGYMTANIEQTSDVQLAVHMPKVYNIQLMPEFPSWHIPELVVEENYIYFTLLKQKDGPSNKGWVLEADLSRLTLQELDLRRFQ